jgi:endonuclease I
MKKKAILALSLVSATLFLSGCATTVPSASSAPASSESLSFSSASSSTTLSSPVSSLSSGQYPLVEQRSDDVIDAHGADSTLIKALDQQMDEDAKDATTSFSYSGMFSVWALSDQDPSNASHIIGFYSGTSASAGLCNREHVWPNSRKGEVTEDDPHVLRPALYSENSSRGNSFYGETTGWDPATFKNPKYRGIAARIIFYSAVRYQEDGLWLEDADNPTSTNANQRPTMGKLSLLLKWNLEYPVDSSEIQRNTVLSEKYRYCRNVFIDHPDYATAIWGHVNSACEQACGL